MQTLENNNDMYLNLNLISAEKADRFNKAFQQLGSPTEDRLLLAVPDSEELKQGSLIIPQTIKEGVPRKGVIVQMGPISESNRIYEELLNIGQIVTFGLYAGKEQEFSEVTLQELGIDNQKFNVISISEIVYIEKNNK